MRRGRATPRPRDPEARRWPTARVPGAPRDPPVRRLATAPAAPLLYCRINRTLAAVRPAAPDAPAAQPNLVPRKRRRSDASRPASPRLAHHAGGRRPRARLALLQPGARPGNPLRLRD